MHLPIHEIQDELLDGMNQSAAKSEPWRALVKAPTGSGKSTGLPSMLLDAGLEGRIIVVQPRRIAARMLARRVADLRGSRLGGEVGYVIRFDNTSSADSRIIYITDGVLQRWLEENPMLDGKDKIGAIVFDEFHERRLAMDIALADCLNLQETHRPDLKVCVMSATLELAGLEEYLEPCHLIEAGGRSYRVEISYQHALAKTKTSHRYGNGEEPIWEKCVRALGEAVEHPDCGNILIFLPGVYEIQKTITLIEQKKLSNRSKSGEKWEICPLYGALKPEQQDRAVRDGGAPRIIVSTNVAETSLTIPGVCTVIDAGLARVSEFDAIRGMDTLFIKKISRAAADQRAGRAGRVAPGRCIRLWSQADHAKRAEFELPEVRRVDMTETALKLKFRGISDLSDFRWLEAPSEVGVSHALDLLEGLGAIGASDENEITALGKGMAAMALHPREARLLIAANAEKCLAEAIFIIALMQTDSGGGGVFMKGRQSGRTQFVYDDDKTDFAADYRAYASAVAMQFTPQRCSAIGVMGRVAREVQQAVQQLERLCSRLGWDGVKREAEFTSSEGSNVGLSRAMFLAYSDRLAVRSGKGNLSCRVTGGRSGKISAESAVANAELFIATSMTEVGAKDVTVHLGGCTEVLLDTVRELRGAYLKEGNEAVYDEKIRRVVNRQQTVFKDLVITTKDTSDKEIDLEAAATLLAERVASGELKLKKWDPGVEQWIARLLSLREWMPELELPGFDEEDRAIALEVICQGALGYKQIKDKEVMPALQGWLSAGQHAALEAYAPSRIKLSNGESAKVKYEVGKPPSIALTVQRLYGVKSSPTLANGAVTVQIHICAPNQRPWQMTQDLENFWQNGFAQMKKDLAGRYPKHRWEI